MNELAAPGPRVANLVRSSRPVVLSLLLVFPASGGAAPPRPVKPAATPAGPKAQPARTAPQAPSPAPVGTPVPAHATTWLDPATELLWTVEDNGFTVNWVQADQDCRSLTLGGHTDWRLPSADELEALAVPAKPRELGIRPPFKLTSPFVWSSTKRDSNSVWYFDFSTGTRYWSFLVSPDADRALCVRLSEK